MKPAGLIASKIAVPDLPDKYVSRPRLRELLRDAIAGHRVVSVAASAGAGKTTAIVDAISDLGCPMAWLGVDRSDAIPGRLLTYLEASVARTCEEARDVATRAIAAQVPHPEAAGLLAETLGERRMVVVIDDVERLGDAEAPWAVIDSFVRYSTATVVLIGRRPLPGHLLDLPAGPVVSVVCESDLAFTTSEAQSVLDVLGRGEEDAARIVATTGGWAAGVVFGTAEGLGRGPSLDGFLDQQVLSRLPQVVQHFLISTALLDEVDADRATALGIPDAHRLLTALHGVHLPAAWDAQHRKFKCHPAFRDFLLDRLARRPLADLTRLRLAHARWLVADGDDESAVDAFGLAMAPDEALSAARRAIGNVIDRADIDLAEDWIRRFDRAESAADPSELTTARLAISVIRDDYGHGLQQCDALLAAGTRETLAKESNRAAVLMIWLYGLAGRLSDALAVADAASVSPEIRAISYGLSLMDPSRPFNPPALTGEAIDAYVLECDYFRGRLRDCMRPLDSRWAEAVTGPYTIGALRAGGQTQRALDAYLGYSSRLGMLPLQAFIGPEILIDAGMIDEAVEAAAVGEEQAASAGAPMYELLSCVVQAKIAARYLRDPVASHRVLDRLEMRPELNQFWCVRDMAGIWRCLSLLLQDRNEHAATRLRQIVSTMVSVGGVLELPTAAIYLAEAEWRLGNELYADRAADIALKAAQRQGSNHILLQALSEFPMVISRRLDAEADTTSAWHDLGRQMSLASRSNGGARGTGNIIFDDMGPPSITINSEVVRPRIAKCYELLAFLLTQPERAASRDLLLTVLFESRRDDASRVYLRQTLRWLKVLVRSDTAIVADRRTVRIGPDVAIRCASNRFESAAAEARRLRDRPRINALLEALSLSNQGHFLDGFDSEWVTQRRSELIALRTETLFDLADALYGEGRLSEALVHLHAALEQESLREAGWRLLMRIDSELGDYDGVLTAFRRCELALAGIGTTASPTTRKLLRDFVP